MDSAADAAAALAAMLLLDEAGAARLGVPEEYTYICGGISTPNHRKPLRFGQTAP